MLLEKIRNHAKLKSETNAIQFVAENRLEGLTWSDLDDLSDKLAYVLDHLSNGDRSPIVVYGHKSPWMVVSFLACMKSGHAYSPVDSYLPNNRVRDMVDSLEPTIIIALEPVEVDSKCKILSFSEIKELTDSIDLKEQTKQLHPLSGDDTLYIIYTSGSSGKPKGVQISLKNVCCFAEWIFDVLGNLKPFQDVNWEQESMTFLNQAPFSFDLSVMDLYLALTTGGTLHSLSKEQINDTTKLFPTLYQANVDVWVSTPSFAEICLIEKNFHQDNFPSIKAFLFCGETLTNTTYEKLQARFPNAAIVNTYGPTESTCALTSILITEEVSNKYNPLPVGYVKPGSEIKVVKDGVEVPEGELGELLILGNTLSQGYYKDEDVNKQAFLHLIPGDASTRGYKTGDEGYISEKLVFYNGRLDFQIKLHGHRIELGDIENNLLKIDGILAAAVIAQWKNDKIRSLTAFVQAENMPTDTFAHAQRIRTRLLEHIPDYMIPKKIVFLEKMPLTHNGKIDRHRLAEMR